MAEEKKGRVKITIEVEVNEPLMDVMKEAMSKMSLKMPEMMRHHGEEK
jgi:hypothetical protein